MKIEARIRGGEGEKTEGTRSVGEKQEEKKEELDKNDKRGA